MTNKTIAGALLEKSRDEVLHLWSAEERIFRSQGATFTKNDLQLAQGGYAEGSPNQYSWAAEFDTPLMVSMRGGKAEFSSQLDAFFHGPEQTGVADMTG